MIGRSTVTRLTTGLVTGVHIGPSDDDVACRSGVDRRRTDEQLDVAGLDAVAIVEAGVAEGFDGDVEREAGGGARLQRRAREALELTYRPGQRRHVITRVELHGLVGGSRPDVGDGDRDVDRVARSDVRVHRAARRRSRTRSTTAHGRTGTAARSTDRRTRPSSAIGRPTPCARGRSGSGRSCADR